MIFLYFQSIAEDSLRITFDNSDKVHSFDPKSYLGKWVLEEDFSNIDQSFVYGSFAL